jgi:hypothetical protein
VSGYCSLDRFDWEAYHEAADLPRQVEQYQARHGYYPESVHADQIYRTRLNRDWYKARGIRLQRRCYTLTQKITFSASPT